MFPTKKTLAWAAVAPRSRLKPGAPSYKF